MSAEENNAECQYFPGGSPVSEKTWHPGRPGTHIRLEVSEDFPAVALKPGDDPCYVFCQNVSPSGWMISAQEMQA